ncbi:Alpha-galactosidase A precursor [Phycisphaerae bacterium RAS1]|nr:Alpha-galactosidase A precursor [Phycisphaerae bacterium RAS1]
MPRIAPDRVAGRLRSDLRFGLVGIAAILSVAGCAQKRDTGLGGEPLLATTRGSNAVWLDELDLSAMDQQWGQPRAGRSVADNPLRMSGAVYQHGVGTHARSEMTIELHGAALRFESAVGVDAESGELGSVVFVVLVDGVERFRSGVLRGGAAAESADVDLSGARQLALIVEDAGDGIDSDHANWAGAIITLKKGTAQRPTALVPDPGPDPEIAPFTPRELAIHAPRITGGTPGRPFLFRIPATGPPPLTFSASALPDGLLLDPQTGVISGEISRPGRSDVLLTAQSPAGLATGALTIVAGPDSLALTPPMGWNSWNVWGTAVDDAKVRAAADALVASGLAGVGYQYVNIDDAWEGQRDGYGVLGTNEKFPDMKGLADYVHSQGLKLGIYSGPGPKTCAGYVASYQHEYIDARTWAEWGIDLLKYDWCSYGMIAADDSLPELMRPYFVMRAALDACGRDIVYSLCQYGMGRVSEWGDAVGGNYWRTTGDITDSWQSMSSIGFVQHELAEFAGLGRWNDPDMLVVGRLGWGPNIRPTRLTKNEQVTHVTLWAMLASPLLIGCDLSQLDDFTLAVLGNPEVLEVNQDPLGKQARRIKQVETVEVWARPLAGGSTAVALFNRGRSAADVSVQWSDLGLSGPQLVRDCWRRMNSGRHETGFTTTVSGHGAAMITVQEQAAEGERR